jgi:hypothetical protein
MRSVSWTEGTTVADYPCPCCGYFVFVEAPGSFDICPIYFWEDDISQLRFPTMAGGANRVALIDAQSNFQSVGASEERFLSKVRRPADVEIRDAAWRPLDSQHDRVERPEPGVDYGTTYPSDGTKLYYWRSHAS